MYLTRAISFPRRHSIVRTRRSPSRTQRMTTARRVSRRGTLVVWVLTTNLCLNAGSFGSLALPLAEHDLHGSLNGGGLGLYPGAELIFGWSLERDRVLAVIEGEIGSLRHHGELF